MTIRTHARSAVVALALAAPLALVGCTPVELAAAPEPTPTSGTPSGESSGAPSPAQCPVTIPSPVPEKHLWRDGLFGWGSAVGNGKLWVGGLGESGVIGRFPGDPPSPDGSIGHKFGWWREVPGSLTITGRRLDAQSPPAVATVPDGYGEEGFQSSGVTFPAPGCWEVTGELDSDPEGTRLTFVTLVVPDLSG